jgi:hypothetical protein
MPPISAMRGHGDCGGGSCRSTIGRSGMSAVTVGAVIVASSPASAQ